MLRTDVVLSGTYPFRPVRVPLEVGERLEYEARWMGFPSGRLVFEVRWAEKADAEGHQVYNLKASINFNSLVSPLYQVDNEAFSVFDAEEGYSRDFIMHKNEGRIRYSEEVHFDYREMLARYVREESLAGPHRLRLAVQIPDKVCDPLSFFYYLRGVHLEPGQDVHLTVHTSQRNWDLTVRVLKRMRLKVPRGTFDVLKLEPVGRFPGLIERKGRLYLYVEERTHVPVLMSTDIPIGSISFRLVKTEKSPLDGPAPAGTETTPAVSHSGTAMKSRARDAEAEKR